MAITLEQIEGLMEFHMLHLSTSGAPIDETTVLANALSPLAVAGVSARALFKALTRRDIVLNGGKAKTWPTGWETQTIKSLAPQLL